MENLILQALISVGGSLATIVMGFIGLIKFLIPRLNGRQGNIVLQQMERITKELNGFNEIKEELKGIREVMNNILINIRIHNERADMNFERSKDKQDMILHTLENLKGRP